MARIVFNSIVKEVSGAFGSVVFRSTANGKIVMANRPGPRDGELTEDQSEHQMRFRRAVAYGKSVMADPTARAAYEEVAQSRNTPIFALTVADFFHAPSIYAVHISEYNGQVGDLIKVEALDDFDVATVTVTITNAATNEEIERGRAVQTGSGSALWEYGAQSEVAAGTEVNINVVAADRPGGTAVNSQTKMI